MYDLHCHILFGVDDGADSAEESIRMARIACESGTKGIAATPHCNISEFNRNEWTSEFTRKIIMLNSTLAEIGVPVKIYPGQEIFCGEDVTTLLKSGELLTLNGSRYVLVEFDFEERSDTVYSKLHQIISAGYIPIVAHPERYGFVQEDKDAPLRMKKKGCLLQLNKGSIKGGFGRGAYVSSSDMLENRFADIVASDAHGPFVRTPCLADAHEFISERFSAEYADILFKSNPKSVLKNKLI